VAGEVGDRDGVLDPDDALVLGGRGELRRLALLAERQLLPAEVAALTGTAAAGSTAGAALLLLRVPAADLGAGRGAGRRRAAAAGGGALGDLDAGGERDDRADRGARRIARRRPRRLTHPRRR